MPVYYRNTNSRFILLWSIFLLLVTGVLFFTIKGMFLPALVTFLLIVVAGNIRIHGLTISANEILVRRYHAFGAKKIEWIIARAKFRDIEFWEHGTEASGQTDTVLDIFILPALFVAGKRGMTFQSDLPGPKTRSFKLYLRNKEYEMIRELASQ